MTNLEKSVNAKQANPWDTIKLDQNGRLIMEDSEVHINQKLIQEKKKKSLYNVRGLIRSLVLVVDVSSCCLEVQSFGMKRIQIIKEQLISFLKNFFDKNPISQISIVATVSESARLISPLTGSLDDLLYGVNELTFMDHKGEPSIQASLSAAVALLGSINSASGGALSVSAPPTTREVLILYGSMTTADYSPIDGYIKKLIDSKIVINVVGLGAKLYILDRLTTETGGEYYVPTSYDNMTTLMNLFVIPPSLDLKDRVLYMIECGIAQPCTDNCCSFDIFALKANPKLINHSEKDIDEKDINFPFPFYGGYRCPKCKTRVRSLPCFCPTCALFLVHYPHLTRTIQNLSYMDVEAHYVEVDKSDLVCWGCNTVTPVDVHKPYQLCNKCNNVFCNDCYRFIIERIECCPGCLQ